jgi:hypothetical protein
VLNECMNVPPWDAAAAAAASVSSWYVRNTRCGLYGGAQEGFPQIGKKNGRVYVRIAVCVCVGFHIQGNCRRLGYAAIEAIAEGWECLSSWKENFFIFFYFLFFV